MRAERGNVLGQRTRREAEASTVCGLAEIRSLRSAKCQIPPTAGIACDDVGGGAKHLSKLMLAACRAQGEGNKGRENGPGRHPSVIKGSLA